MDNFSKIYRKLIQWKFGGNSRDKKYLKIKKKSLENLFIFVFTYKN